ncbi:hypothetical protein [Haloarcula halophila]|nr:hypothetical protein [Halomicroarcula sp. DFY41]
MCSRPPLGTPPEADGELSYDQRADAAAEAARQVSTTLAALDRD